MKYFIFDEKGSQIGNPKGYATIGRALGVVNNPRTNVAKHIFNQPHIAGKAIWAIRPKEQ